MNQSMSMRLSEAAGPLHGVLKGEDVAFCSVSTDTRTLQKGDLYIALKGPRFNGHDCLQEAAEKGAVACIVSEVVDTRLPKIEVKHTTEALGRLAAFWKSRYSPLTIAVTGSSGKTTVKELMASIFDRAGPTLATQGNLNNDIGVPLTLLRIRPEHQFAIIEMGANHLGEIAYTSGLTQPDIALITNAGSAHLEGFGSRSNIAKAKGEIYRGLSPQGIAVINADDQYADYWAELNDGRQIVRFSVQRDDVECYATDIQVNVQGQFSFTLCVGDQTIDIQLALLGRHNVANAVAAASVAHAAGIALSVIKEGLEAAAPVAGRLSLVALGQHTVIDDSYNANPASIKAAADLLTELPEPRVMVLGDMAELGIHAPSLHSDVGAYIAQHGVDTLLVKGRHATDYLAGFTMHKNSHQAGLRFDDAAALADYLVSRQESARILVKGSRSAHMEDVIEQLRDKISQCEVNH